MRYSDRFEALCSEIPFGGFGRSLTEHECREIRRHGFSCSPKYIVVRAFDCPTIGIIYKPLKCGGYSNEEIFITTKGR